MRPLRPARRHFPKSALHPHLGARSALRPRPPPRPLPTLRPAQRDGARPKSAQLPAADSPPASALLNTRKCPQDAKGGCIPASHRKTIGTIVGTPTGCPSHRKGPGHQEEERKRNWTLRSASMAFCTCRARASSRVRARTCFRLPISLGPRRPEREASAQRAGAPGGRALGWGQCLGTRDRGGGSGDPHDRVRARHVIPAPPRVEPFRFFVRMTGCEPHTRAHRGAGGPEETEGDVGPEVRHVFAHLVEEHLPRARRSEPAELRLRPGGERRGAGGGSGGTMNATQRCRDATRVSYSRIDTTCAGGPLSHTTAPPPSPVQPIPSPNPRARASLCSLCAQHLHFDEAIDGHVAEVALQHLAVVLLVRRVVLPPRPRADSQRRFPAPGPPRVENQIPA